MQSSEFEQPLNSSEEDEQILVVDKIFNEAYSHFKFVEAASLFFCVLKVTISPIFIFGQGVAL